MNIHFQYGSDIHTSRWLKSQSTIKNKLKTNSFKIVQKLFQSFNEGFSLLKLLKYRLESPKCELRGSPKKPATTQKWIYPEQPLTFMLKNIDIYL